VGFLRDIWEGHLSLSETYWASIVIGIAYSIAGLVLMLIFKSDIITWSLNLGKIVFSVFFSMALWRTIRLYDGPKIWIVVAYAIVAVNILGLAAGASECHTDIRCWRNI